MLAVLFIAAALTDASSDEPRRHDTSPRCDVTSLSEVFHNPTNYFGQTFCGRVLILRDGRGLKVFPSTRRLPRDRNGVVMLLDDNTESAITGTEGSSLRFYVEGTISGMEECFEQPPPGYSNSCEPIRYPLFIHVSRFRNLAARGLPDTVRAGNQGNAGRERAADRPPPSAHSSDNDDRIPSNPAATTRNPSRPPSDQPDQPQF